MEIQFDFADWRWQCAISQEQAAEYLGVSLRTVAGMETKTAPVGRPTELACLYLEGILARKPALPWEVTLTPNSARVAGHGLEIVFSTTAKYTLSLFSNVSGSTSTLEERADLLVDAARAAIREMRLDANELVKMQTIVGHEPPAERLARFKEGGWIAPSSMGYMLTPEGRKRAGLRGRIARAV